LVVWILTHWPFHTLDGAAMRVQFLDEQNVVHVLARESIWRGDNHPVELGQRRPVAQLVESWSAQARAAVTGSAEDLLLSDRFTLCVDVGLQALQLVLNGVRLGLSAGRGRDTGVEGNTHQLPPAAGRAESLGCGLPRDRPSHCSRC
jgi:hypothetical protein